MLFIGYNYNKIPISVISARSRELANAFWQGKGTVPHTVKCLEEDFTPLSEHITGVIPLVHTEEVNLVDRMFDDRARPYVVVKT